MLCIGTGNANIVTLTGSLTNLHYSHQQESAADVYALEAIISGITGMYLIYYFNLPSDLTIIIFVGK